MIVTISNGKVNVNGQIDANPRFEVSRGATVEIRVTSDAAEEVHVHGYDYYLEPSSGETAKETFVANLPGIWEVELHRGHRSIFELAVS